MDSPQDEKKDFVGSEQVTKVETLTYRGAHLTHHVIKNEKDLDTAASLANGVVLSEEEKKYILRKIDWKLLPFMLTLYMMQFLDKTTLGLSVLLGLKTANNVTTAQYNWLATVFYISYLAFELPQSLGLQRFPVAKFLSLNIMSWGIFLALHASCSNFTGLLICRFMLGICEGSVTSGFMIITSQYYTAVEQGQRVGAWFLMNGTAQIFSGLLSYGIHHIYSDTVQQWQILFILTGGLTFLLGLAYWFFFPDSPVNAKFLTPKERIMAIERIRENKTGIENKHWKRYQFIEALTDVKVWLFFLFSLVDNIPNALTTQNSVIYTQLGFSTLTSTLLGIPNGIIEIFTIGSGIYFLGKFPNSRSWIAMLYFIPNILGSTLVLALPFENKYGLLGALYITGFGTTGFVISLAWLQSTTAGHTKKTTAMFINLCGYCLGNIIGPQLFQPQYAPRNTVPWITILTCYTLAPLIVFSIRTLLIRRNTTLDLAALKRKEDGMDSEEELVEVTHADGNVTVEKVDTRWRDLTDKENLEFRYCL